MGNTLYSIVDIISLIYFYVFVLTSERLKNFFEPFFFFNEKVVACTKQNI